ncbi:hypothetical protein H311_03028, partial [Anncaliia algerae PRA109]
MVKRDNKVRLLGHGLKNKGNDCFFNSVMQCVLSVVDLTTFYSENKFNDKQVASKGFQSFIEEYKSSNPLSPESFITTLRPKIALLNGKQQDSHEFLITFIDLLFKELTNATREVINSSTEYNRIKLNNFIADTFFGLQQTTVICGTCLNKSTSPSIFSILTLPVTNDLNDSIYLYSKETLLQGQDQFKCNTCSYSKASKHSIDVLCYPKILVIHLMRFSGAFRKIDDPINIPRELTLNKEKYDVFGLTCHSGVLSSGHYVSYSKRNSVWYYFNDSSVTKIESPP